MASEGPGRCPGGCRCPAKELGLYPAGTGPGEMSVQEPPARLGFAAGSLVKGGNDGGCSAEVSALPRILRPVLRLHCISLP